MLEMLHLPAHRSMWHIGFSIKQLMYDGMMLHVSAGAHSRCFTWGCTPTCMTGHLSSQGKIGKSIYAAIHVRKTSAARLKLRHVKTTDRKQTQAAACAGELAGTLHIQSWVQGTDEDSALREHAGGDREKQREHRHSIDQQNKHLHPL